MRLWPRRYLTCSVCGRNGERWKFDHGGGSLPVCTDREFCSLRVRFRQALAAMPSLEEYRAMVRDETDRRPAEMRQEHPAPPPLHVDESIITTIESGSRERRPD